MGSTLSLLTSFVAASLAKNVSGHHSGQGITSFLVLFGSLDRPWNIESWQEVSDTVRGGRSKAKLAYIDGSNRFAGITFEGELDTKTLGGAGFASQVYRRPISIDGRYDSFFLEVEPISHGSSRPLIRTFTLGVKNVPLSAQSDPSSSLIYQFDFKITPSGHRTSQSEAQNQESKLQEFIKVRIPFTDLVPTYRGQPKPDEKPFDPRLITEMSIMCRSFFDRQSGPFSLNILRLGVE